MTRIRVIGGHVHHAVDALRHAKADSHHILIHTRCLAMQTEETETA